MLNMNPLGDNGEMFSGTGQERILFIQIFSHIKKRDPKIPFKIPIYVGLIQLEYYIKLVTLTLR